MPKQACINCHYFHKSYRDDNGREIKLEITKEMREKTKNDDYSWRIPDVSMSCYKGVWDQGHNFSLDTATDLICNEERKNRCYFWKYMPGTFLPTAVDLQTRQEEMKSNSRGYRLAILGLVITVVGLLVKVLSQ
ncbi:hypothetical protein A9267_10900 [Shewanella sp. UCD-FRSSP16_17]|nr:hypothetical protein A9267_10900 [Shewanella sp. UCD-FRSSP16_17]